MEGAQNLANVAPRDSAPIAPNREPAVPTAAQKRRREETSEDEEEDESSVDDERSTDGEDDGSSLKDFIAEDDELTDRESSAGDNVATAKEAEENIGELQQEAQALLNRQPLQCEVIGGRTLRPRATLKPAVDLYWERFGKKEAERLEALERKNEKLVELRMWIKDGLWTFTTPLSKRSTKEEVDAEHARACAALEISSSDEDEDCEDDEESSEQESDEGSEEESEEESDEESDKESDEESDSDQDSDKGAP